MLYFIRQSGFVYDSKKGGDTLHIAICEDQESEQMRLSNAIKDWASARDISVDIFTYSHAEAFLFAWPDTSFDLAFLDIQMKHMSGIQLAEQIRLSDKNILIVFVTSFSQYVLRGYDVDALHYLIKPLSATKLIPILDKAHVVWRSRKKESLLVSDGAGQLKLPFGDIFSIRMLSHIAEIHTEQKTYEIRKTATELENRLPSHFMRCHRSCIVNLFKADCVYKNSLLLSNGVTLPISRNHTKKINDAYMRLYTE